MFDQNASLEYLLHAFHRMHHGCMRYEFERRGVQDIGNPSVLFILRHNVGDRPVTQREIADKLGVSPPTVAVAVKRMESAGLVHRQTDESDLRKNWISLTDKGKRYTDNCLEVERQIYQQIVEGFTAEEIGCMRGYYIRMLGNMQQLGCRWPKFLDKKPDETGKEREEDRSAGTGGPTQQ